VNLESVLKFLNPQAHAVEKAQEVISRVLDREDSLDLADQAQTLYVMCDGQSRLDLTWLVFDALREAGPLVMGAVLRDAWMDGKFGSPLTVNGYTKAQVMRWFRRASPQTLMNESERKRLSDLPDPVQAFRGALGPTLRKAASGMSWTLDATVAGFFTARYEKIFRQKAITITAELPREAVVAYFDERQESELVANYRRARNVVALSVR
jgi:hypothetical protein